MKKDNISEKLKKDKKCREVLNDLVSYISVGKSSFNRPGYVNAAMSRLFPHKPLRESQGKIESSLNFYEEVGLIEISGNTIEIRKEALAYL